LPVGLLQSWTRKLWWREEARVILSRSPTSQERKGSEEFILKETLSKKMIEKNEKDNWYNLTYHSYIQMNRQTTSLIISYVFLNIMKGIIESLTCLVILFWSHNQHVSLSLWKEIIWYCKNISKRFVSYFPKEWLSRIK